ncbi:hypothetical protein [Devosia sp. RR2S18]|uniref:hypothetical protein n=1 Tax=Devosia rhizosphaerae TaxID=3049774 RepID=UPI0025410615|nr:hypothetical protein [Devosia sp. RR2S18]WIJ25209.1 hypothetical protein QOV41_00060 [Devosia sp. RR2S18]
MTRAPAVVRANRRNGTPDQLRAHHGYFYSWKLDALIPYRGLLAFDYLTLTEADPRVIQIDTSLESVQWTDGTQWKDYRARYGVVRRTRRGAVPHTVEVEVLNSKTLTEQYRTYSRIKRAFKEEGRQLLIFTEKQIRIEPRLTNSKLILTHAGNGICKEEDLALVRQVAAGTAPFSLNQLVENCVLTYPRAYGAVLNLVASGELVFPMGKVFDGDSPVMRRI